MNLKSFLPDFGPSGFYEGFLRFVEIGVYTFLIGGFTAVTPYLDTLLSNYSATEQFGIKALFMGGLVWIVTWLKSRKAKLESSAPSTSVPVDTTTIPVL